MKREILFRGKRIDNSEWIEGYFYEECGATYIIEDRQKETMLNRNTPYKVLPETVCQLTGITDKNGVKIFEGDVVRWSFGQHYWEAVISSIENNKSNTLYAIETFHNCTKDEEGYYTYERSDSRRGTRNDIEFMSMRIEVIGTIHDNPELINK